MGLNGVNVPACAYILMTAEKCIKICSKCGSEDVHIDFSNPVVWAYGTRSNYRCENCQYVGDLFPEVPASQQIKYEKRIKSKHNEPKDEELIDNVPGFFAGILQGILGIIGLFIMLIFLIKEEAFNGILFVVVQFVLISPILYFVWKIIKLRKEMQKQ